MTRSDKLYKRLDQLELDLSNFLLKELTTIENGVNPWIFYSPETNPIWNEWMWEKENYARLLSQVGEIEKLRIKLNETKTEGIVSIYRKYCDEHNVRKNENRLGPKNLAKQMIAEIKESGHAI